MRALLMPSRARSHFREASAKEGRRPRDGTCRRTRPGSGHYPPARAQADGLAQSRSDERVVGEHQTFSQRRFGRNWKPVHVGGGDTQPLRQRLWVCPGERELATLRLRVVMYLVGGCTGRGRSHIISASSSTATIPMIKSANAAKS